MRQSFFMQRAILPWKASDSFSSPLTVLRKHEDPCWRDDMLSEVNNVRYCCWMYKILNYQGDIERSHEGHLWKQFNLRMILPWSCRNNRRKSFFCSCIALQSLINISLLVNVSFWPVLIFQKHNIQHKIWLSQSQQSHSLQGMI